MGETASAIKGILRLVAGTHSVLPTQIFRSDNGTEFKNKLVDSLLAESNIQRELTCVDISQQNGVAEVALRKLFAVARTMLVDASLPPKFWGEAILCATHVHNRLPCSSNANNASPYEVRFGHMPDVRHLRPFGVSTFVRIKSHITKVMPRAEKGTQKGCLLYTSPSPRD